MTEQERKRLRLLRIQVRDRRRQRNFLRKFPLVRMRPGTVYFVDDPKQEPSWGSGLWITTRSWREAFSAGFSREEEERFTEPAGQLLRTFWKRLKTWLAEADEQARLNDEFLENHRRK